MKRWAGLAALVLLAAVLGARATSRRASPAPPPGPAVPGPPAATTSRDPPLTVARWLGWQIRDALDGVLVVSVHEGGPAARAGLGPGDRIATFGGETASVRSILAVLQRTPVGAELAVERRASSGGLERVSIRVESAACLEALLARTIGAGVKALAALQGTDGLWPDHVAPRSGVAVSALACAALAAIGSSGGEPASAALARGRAALEERLAADGGLDDPGEPVARRVYANAAFVLALPPGAERDRVRAWLAAAQIQDVDPLDARRGGFLPGGRGPDARGPVGRADISATAWALEALAASGLPADRPDDRGVWALAARFVESCQNLELQGDPREAPLLDGGFAFAPHASKAGRDDVSPELSVARSYGSATADGLRALLALTGGSVRDDRIEAALAWLARSWCVERVPGFDASSPWANGLELYWLAVLARALHGARVGRIAGHDWPDEVARAVAGLQDPASGSFAAPDGLMGTDSPAVATSLALLALAAARDGHLRAGSGGARVLAATPPVALPPRVPWAVADAGTLERGRAIFQGSLGCVGCHSDVASGNGPSLVGVADRWLEWKRTRPAAKDYFKRHIRDPGAAPGQHAERWPPDRMPHFGESSGLGDDDLDALVEFLLARGGTLPVSEARGPGPGVRGSAQRGQEVAFERKCASCHDTAYFLAHRRPDLGKHPPFEKPLSDQEVADVLAFLKTLR